ncbi:MAG: Ca2+-dependent phosphoinositide-specific phospholipase C [bacterium]
MFLAIYSAAGAEPAKLLFTTATLVAAEPEFNQIQVIGSHNSYHIAPHDDLNQFLSITSKRLVESIDYTHPPLPDQFSRFGIRQIELDLFLDPKGGHYARPSARQTLSFSAKTRATTQTATVSLKSRALKCCSCLMLITPPQHRHSSLP